MGLHRAWPDAEIIGVDIKPQKNYPFRFIQADAMTLPIPLPCSLLGYSCSGCHGPDGCSLGSFWIPNFIWASPPCQGYSATSVLWKREHPMLVPDMRVRLEGIGIPWVMENVVGAPLRTSLSLCGAMFFLRVYRHRLFESSHLIPNIPHPRHLIKASATRKSARRAWDDGEFLTICGNGGNTAKWAGVAMDIDWMTGDELSQAIPPAYSEYIAKQLSPALGVNP